MNEPTNDLPSLLALDLETTGLDPRSETILEVAAMSVDARDLSVSGSFHAFNDIPIDTTFSFADEKVVEMHTRNGLIDELRDRRNAGQAVPLVIIDDQLAA